GTMNKLKKWRGQAMVGALMTTVAVGLLAVAVPKVVGYLNDRNRALKVKSVMMATEASLRSKLARSDSFTCTTTGCTIAIPLSMMQRGSVNFNPVLGTECPAGMPSGCGVEIRSQPAVGGRMKIVLHYEAKTPKVSDWDFMVDIPAHGDNEPQCPPSGNTAAVVFGGIDADGKAICRSLDAECPAGSFVDHYDPNTLHSHCTSLPSTLVVCPNDKFIDRVKWKWNSQGAFTVDFNPASDCRKRKDSSW
ncbi:MAG: hypothetical protein ABIR96_08415, partial [Bdellovibrionota bacterium]